MSDRKLKLNDDYLVKEDLTEDKKWFLSVMETINNNIIDYETTKYIKWDDSLTVHKSYWIAKLHEENDEIVPFEGGLPPIQSYITDSICAERKIDVTCFRMTSNLGTISFNLQSFVDRFVQGLIRECVIRVRVLKIGEGGHIVRRANIIYMIKIDNWVKMFYYEPHGSVEKSHACYKIYEYLKEGIPSLEMNIIGTDKGIQASLKEDYGFYTLYCFYWLRQVVGLLNHSRTIEDYLCIVDIELYSLNHIKDLYNHVLSYVYTLFTESINTRGIDAAELIKRGNRIKMWDRKFKLQDDYLYANKSKAIYDYEKVDTENLTEDKKWFLSVMETINNNIIDYETTKYIKWDDSVPVHKSYWIAKLHDENDEIVPFEGKIPQKQLYVTIPKFYLKQSVYLHSIRWKGDYQYITDSICAKRKIDVKCFFMISYLGTIYFDLQSFVDRFVKGLTRECVIRVRIKQDHYAIDELHDNIIYMIKVDNRIEMFYYEPHGYVSPTHPCHAIYDYLKNTKDMPPLELKIIGKTYKGIQAILKEDCGFCTFYCYYWLRQVVGLLNHSRTIDDYFYILIIEIYNLDHIKNLYNHVLSYFDTLITESINVKGINAIELIKKGPDHEEYYNDMEYGTHKMELEEYLRYMLDTYNNDTPSITRILREYKSEDNTDITYKEAFEPPKYLGEITPGYDYSVQEDWRKGIDEYDKKYITAEEEGEAEKNNQGPGPLNLHIETKKTLKDNEVVWVSIKPKEKYKPNDKYNTEKEKRKRQLDVFLSKYMSPMKVSKPSPPDEAKHSA
jgi:hypothetical protein